jgi:hypothetical protein
MNREDGRISQLDFLGLYHHRDISGIPFAMGAPGKEDEGARREDDAGAGDGEVLPRQGSHCGMDSMRVHYQSLLSFS